MFIEDNKIPLSMLKLSFLKLSKFTGSYKEYNYCIEKVVIEDKDKLKLALWTKKTCYSLTKESDMTITYYSFDNEGIANILKYLSETFDK